VTLSLAEGRPVIACPWHHYEFDLQTGHEIRGGRRAITYQVELDGGRVYLRTGPNSAAEASLVDETL
jgi:nitrite reductase/ring-hydroxylating ferredoxin subunit